jgi:D-amino-acid dehydrogenase
MSQNYDIIIIGGGVIGLCVAYYLRQEGCRVALLEKGELGSGSSWANAGLIVPSHFIPLAAPGAIGQGLRWMFSPESPFYIKPRFDLALFDWLWQFRAACTQSHVNRAMPLLRDLHLASLELYQRLATLLDFGFQTRGLLLLYKYEAGQHECQELVETAHQIELEAEMLTADQVQARLPGLDVQATGGAYFPRDAHLDPAQFVTQLGQYLRQQEVDLFTQTEAIGLTIANQKVTAVVTSQGQFTAAEVVLAGGAWSPGLVRSVGLKLPIQAAKGYSFTLPQPNYPLEIPLLFTDARIAVTPLPQGIRFAGTLELAGLNLSINFRRVQAIRRAIPAYLGQLNLTGLEQVETWAGLRPCTPDGLPVIGRTSNCSNLTVATGHAMLGISLAPITGQLVVQIITGQPPSVDVSALSLARFN